ncbi:transposase [Maioricimonas sp. JC845]|uniref:transposase n=1 Tax=Maioricimonas sp. JC845 TaxID=3232138 RepID=UPI00345B39CD
MEELALRLETEGVSTFLDRWHLISSIRGSRYLWLTREENLLDKRAATFAELRETNLKTSQAWALRELFREFWEQPGEFTGRLFFGEWYAWASRCRLGTEPLTLLSTSH